MEKRLFNIKEAALYLNLSKNTLYQWICQRRIPFVKCGRLVKFDIEDLNSWIDSNKIKVIV